MKGFGTTTMEKICSMGHSETGELMGHYYELIFYVAVSQRSYDRHVLIAPKVQVGHYTYLYRSLPCRFSVEKASSKADSKLLPHTQRPNKVTPVDKKKLCIIQDGLKTQFISHRLHQVSHQGTMTTMHWPKNNKRG